MTRKEKDLDAWWRDVQAFSDADLQIGYRVTPRVPARSKAKSLAKKPSAKTALVHKRKV